MPPALSKVIIWMHCFHVGFLPLPLSIIFYYYSLSALRYATSAAARDGGGWEQPTSERTHLPPACCLTPGSDVMGKLTVGC